MKRYHPKDVTCDGGCCVDHTGQCTFEYEKDGRPLARCSASPLLESKYCRKHREESSRDRR